MTLKAAPKWGDTYITNRHDTYQLTSWQIIQNEGISLNAAAFLNLTGDLIFATHDWDNVITIHVNGWITTDVVVGAETLHFTNWLLTSIT